ncbi:MAG: Glycine/sarcosine/betaine reductase complex component C subunit alpha [Firmicutes bacterium ADurb.Bin506]|nr:MAG: Glycine/sarcosine/betaine reductase complex component C subunit alpha [Firmicutes bacterium ADurb.Bin506]
MVRNAVYGIAAAKACGIERPTVGILNVDGARQVERALRRISEAGYALEFAESARADGGTVMRGNDLLMGVPDVMVTDTLTGNLLMKMFSSYSTGGDYEATGWGYGPGVGEGYGRIIMILSRASGAPVVAGAIAYAAELVRGGLVKVANAEFAAARAAGWPGGRDKGAGAGTGVAPGSAPGSGPGSVPGSTPGGEPVPAPSPAQGEVAAPPAKVVTAEIAGVDILELENAVRVLWAAGIYAESGMGCTGPIVMVSPEDRERAVEALKQAQYL